MRVPQIGDSWGAGYRVRSGDPGDAATITRWCSSEQGSAVRWALDDAIRALRSRSSPTTVYTLTASDPVGLLTISSTSPYLQLVYLDEAHRQSDIGTRATCIVVEHFFAHRAGEPWLGVTRPITTAGVRLFLRLGFWELDSGMQLVRNTWRANLADVARRFR